MKRGRKKIMPIMIAFAIVAIAAIAITFKTYVGYGEYQWYTRLSFLIFLVLGWCAPFLAFALRHHYSTGGMVIASKCLYFLFGFVFFLFAISLIRDLIWIVLDLIRRVPVSEIKNPLLLQKVNIVTFIFCLLFCFYGVYEAEKDARIVSYNISSPKIKEETKVVMMSDLHIDTDVSQKYVERLVQRVNALEPDAIVIVGDVIDNAPHFLMSQMGELQNLSAKYGTYVTLGNHEFYSGVMDWVLKFGQMQFNILNNYGMRLGNTGIYIAGLPDVNAAQGSGMKINLRNTFMMAQKEDYVILLEHTPKLYEGINKENTDLQLSGHTHGGQIYPFHYFTAPANDGRLAGFYNQDGVDIYVSRGTRYWGPPMRIFAPSEITVFNFLPAKKDAQSVN